jgi:hypothetical protein
MTRSLLTLVALVCLWSPALAGPAPVQKPTLDSRLDVRVEATPAADVFRQIINGLGYELQMDPSIDAPVTLWVTHVSARTALNVVCESLGCTWRVDGNRLVVGRSGQTVITPDRKDYMIGVVTKPGAGKPGAVALDLRAHLKKPLPVDMQFQDVPVSTILRAMSEVSGLEITAEEPLLSRHVTLTGSGKTVEDALKAVIEQAGGGTAVMFRIWDRGNAAGPAIRIAIKPRPVVVKK